MTATLTPGEFIRAAVMRGIAEDDQRRSSDESSQVRLAVESPAEPAAGSRFNIVLPLKDGRKLAYNTQSGAFAVWSVDEATLFERVTNDEVPVNDPALKDFVDGGYVVSSNVDQLAAFQEIYNGTRFDPVSMIVTIVPTSACNFSCDYCFQGLDKPNTKMSDVTQDAFIAFLAKTLPRLKNLSIVWFGGEPLMGLATIRTLSRRMLVMCRKARVKYDAFIVTNGYFLTGEVARELYSLRVTSCQVTFDGPANYHDQRRHFDGNAGDEILAHLA